MHITIALSWFHRKVGPIVFYSYPEDDLEEDEKIRIADQIDQAFEEGFFSRSFDNLISMNYYFEIYSKWARGQKEMLMISAIFDESVPSDIQHDVLGQCIDFANRLKNKKEIFKAFYNEEDPQYSAESELILKYNEMIKTWIKELYWTVIEVTREKSEEEILAELMSKKSVYSLVKFLGNGPVSREDLNFWFDIKFPDENLDDLLKQLEDTRVVFINDIGVENYVLLVKEITIERIPPVYIITLFEEKPEMAELVQIFSEKVQDFFDNYEKTAEDSINLFNLISDARKYNVLSQLRTGPIPKDQLSGMFSKAQLDQLFKTLDTLKDLSIIDEFNYNDENLVILITDVRITSGFPKYLSEIIPKETKRQIAKAYEPKRSSEGEIDEFDEDEMTDETLDLDSGELELLFGTPKNSLNDMLSLAKSMESDENNVSRNEKNTKNDDN